MKKGIDSCELASTVTAISCAIAKCVPKENLALVASIFGQIASTLGTILENEDLLYSEDTAPIIPPTTTFLSSPNTETR